MVGQRSSAVREGRGERGEGCWVWCGVCVCVCVCAWEGGGGGGREGGWACVAVCGREGGRGQTHNSYYDQWDSAYNRADNRAREGSVYFRHCSTILKFLSRSNMSENILR